MFVPGEQKTSQPAFIRHYLVTQNIKSVILMVEQRAPYWPEGWNRERLLNSSATGELEHISHEEVRAIRKDLIADIGEPAFQDLMAEMG